MQSFSDWVQFAVASAVVILFLLILISLIILIVKRGRRAEKSAFSVEHLNKTWTKNEDIVRSEILPHKEFSALLKKRKKAEQEKSESAKAEQRRRVFVIDFDGDLNASACSNLREMISVLIAVARPSDEVVVRLESPGGIVHGYGLAASQLARLTAHHIPLTVCVDKVAASGGYMMACVANKIVAAPFSIIGSIGVISSMPNFNRLLKKHDIDFVEQTAGEFKRTITLFGELNEAKMDKHQQDLNIIHGLFKEHVAHHRPQVNIDQVSTGEIWLGHHALKFGLIDELKTSDDLLIELGTSADVYLLKSEQEPNWKTKLMRQFFGTLRELKLPVARINDKLY